MRVFEFHAYPGDDNGAVSAEASITTREFAETAQAKAYGGRLAKEVNGPVDVALWTSAGLSDWSERYITTASPSEYHANGYRFERLS